MTIALAAAAVLSSGAAFTQSLGELAKQEEERRKTITTKGKVYTNETIRAESRTPAQASAPPVPTAPAAPPSQSGVVPPSVAGQPPSAQAAAREPLAPDAKQDEATWRKRIQTERDLLQRAQIFADALQSRINALTADFAARDDPFQREQLSTDRLKAVAELDRVTQEIEQHRKAIAGIQEEARRAGVPPGWVR